MQRQTQSHAQHLSDLAVPVPARQWSYQSIHFSALLAQKGFATHAKIAGSLQGSVWSVSKNRASYVAKVSSRILYEKQASVVQGREVHVDEDILKEAKILKHLSTQADTPPSIAKFVKLVQDPANIILVVENGGMRLFDYVNKCHQCITQGNVQLATYQSFVRAAFAQIVQCVDWMHSKMQCCHLDLSLENMTISGGMTKFQVKLIDFGLAELYSNKYFGSAKYVGKPAYQSPEIYAKSAMFDARGADVWSLGVTLYMMTLGHAPFQRASLDDQYYSLIKKDGRLNDLLVSWKKQAYVTPQWIKLIISIFVDEKDRPNIQEIRKHPFLAAAYASI